MLNIPSNLRIKVTLVMAAILLAAVLWLAVYANTPPKVPNPNQTLDLATQTVTSAEIPVSYPATPTPQSTPGLVVYGVVRDKNGVGIENVEIYRQYASYEGRLIATTDTLGYYQSGFGYIPGDEMVSIWASKAGLKFDPEHQAWRHYHGYEITRLDFTERTP